MKRLLIHLATAVLTMAPNLARADVRPAVCVSPAAGACTEWRVYTSENTVETDEHAYLSWSEEEWTSALASCRGAGGTAVTTGMWPFRQTINVSGGLCGRLFAIENLCRSRSAGDAVAAECVKWGLRPEITIPKIVDAISANWDGLEKCGFMFEGMSKGFGLPSGSKVKWPATPENLRSPPGRIMAAVGRTKQLYAEVAGSPVGQKVKEAYDAYKGLKRVGDFVDETEEKLQKAKDFIELSERAKPNRLLAMLSLGTPQIELYQCAVASGGRGDEAFMDCYAKAVSHTPDAVQAAQALSEYMNTLDAVQCFSASGAVTSTLSLR